ERPRDLPLVGRDADQLPEFRWRDGQLTEVPLRVEQFSIDGPCDGRPAADDAQEVARIPAIPGERRARRGRLLRVGAMVLGTDTSGAVASHPPPPPRRRAARPAPLACASRGGGIVAASINAGSPGAAQNHRPRATPASSRHVAASVGSRPWTLTCTRLPACQT